MKAKRLKRRSAEETPRKSFVVSGSAVAPALYKAKIPTRFVRPNVSLGDFEWGERMSSWIDGSLPECSEKGGLYLRPRRGGVRRLRHACKDVSATG